MKISGKFKKQIKFCVDLRLKTKTEYFKDLNVKDISGERTFRKTIKSCFGNKGLNWNKILLKEKGKLVSDKKEVATITKNLFIFITQDLELKKDNNGKHNNLEDTLKAFESHSSIEKNKKDINTTEDIFFGHVKKQWSAKVFYESRWL